MLSCQLCWLFCVYIFAYDKYFTKVPVSVPTFEVYRKLNWVLKFGGIQSMWTMRVFVCVVGNVTYVDVVLLFLVSK